MKRTEFDDGRITGPWTLKELKDGTIGAEPNGLKVFSCFHCGGGSTMGYKLAGFEVLGGVEIDPEMSKIYVKNQEPKHEFLMGVQEFKNIPDAELPPELFGIDVLDGSPPCSSFSTAGSRENAWGEKKKFREGQAEQVLDDLFFDFIDIAAKLKPKIVVAENVKGLVMGKAKGYVKQIFQAFERAGYNCQLYLLNASCMGVPQMRERTFFVARRKDLGMPKFLLEYQEEHITLEKAFVGTDGSDGKPLSEKASHWWSKTMNGRLYSVCGAETGKMNRRLSPDLPAWTQTATPNLFHWSSPRGLSKSESIRVQSFPDDFNFLNQKPGYVCGMSVPPLMMQRVALEVARALGATPRARRPRP